MLNIHTIINIIHILLIGPGLIYIGQTYGALPNIAFNIILVLGLGIMVYHAYKAYSIGIKLAIICVLIDSSHKVTQLFLTCFRISI